MKHRQSDIFLQMRRQQLLLKRQVFNIFQSNFLKNLISLPHQVTHTRFLTITLYQCFCCLLLEIYLFPHLLCQPIIVFGLLNDVFFEYLHLLYRSVSVHLDSLQSVQQGWENSVQGVGGAYEQDSRQIDLDIHEIVFEFVVLNRVEDLHDCVLKTGSVGSVHYLVDLVEQNHWILSFGSEDRVPNLARICPHIGLTMTLDDRSVILSTQRYSSIWSSQTFRNGFNDRSLAYTWRTIQQQNLRFELSFQFANRNELNHTVMILLQYQFSLGNIILFLDQNSKRIISQQIYIMFLSTDIMSTLTLHIRQLRFNQFTDIFRIVSFFKFLFDFINIFLLIRIAQNTFSVIENSLDCLFLSQESITLRISKIFPM